MTRPDAIQVGIDAQAAWTELANIIPLLRVCLSPRSTHSEIRSLPKSKPPIDMTVSKLLAEIDDEAGFYVHVLMEETHDYTPPLALDARCRSLAGRHGHFTIAEDRTGLDFLSCAQTLVSKAHGLITRPPAPSWRGPCRVIGCDGQMYAKHDWGFIQCDECETAMDVDMWRAGLQSALESRLMRRVEIMPALKMLGAKSTSSTIRTWIERGRLVPVIREPELFRFTDVMDLAKAKIVA